MILFDTFSITLLISVENILRKSQKVTKLVRLGRICFSKLW